MSERTLNSPGRAIAFDSASLAAALVVLVAAAFATNGFLYQGGGLQLDGDHRAVLLAWTLGALPLWLVLGRIISRLNLSGSGAVLLALFAATCSIVIRYGVLRCAPVADDETTYRFAARTLALGRLWMDSPSPRLAFDRTFFINDGRWFTQYTLGWPALLAIPDRLGVAGLVAPLMLGATVVLADRVARTFSPDGWVATLMIATSTGLLVTSATLLSHAACIFALTASTFGALRSKESPHPGWGALMATGYSVAVWTRPSSAVGIGTVWVVHWAYHWARRGLPWREGVAAAVPAAMLGGAFLACNQVMNGSPFAIGYASVFRFVVQNHHRFSTIDPQVAENFLFNLSPTAIVGTQMMALMRVNNDLAGWPISLILVPFARFRDSGVRWLVASIACFLVIHLAVNDVGLEDVAPTHFVELFVPLAWLSASGASRLSADNPVQMRGLVLAGALLGLGFTAIRVRHLYDVAAETRRPLDVVSHLDNALIFAPFPFFCRRPGAPPTSVLASPANRPDLSGRLVWVNDLGTVENQAVALQFPYRTAMVLSFDEACAPVVTRLQAAR